MLQFLRNTRWAILWGILIFVLTGIPGSVLPEYPEYLDLLRPDKLAHIAVFAVFFILLAISFRKEGTPPRIHRYASPAAFLICLTVALSTELIQEFIIPLRVASVWDFIANLAGSLAGWGIVIILKR